MLSCFSANCDAQLFTTFSALNCCETLIQASASLDGTVKVCYTSVEEAQDLSELMLRRCGIQAGMKFDTHLHIRFAHVNGSLWIGVVAGCRGQGSLASNYAVAVYCRSRWHCEGKSNFCSTICSTFCSGLDKQLKQVIAGVGWKRRVVCCSADWAYRRGVGYCHQVICISHP